MNNKQIAQTFQNVAELMGIRGDNFHRILAYKRAAETINDLNRPLRDIHAEDGLTDLPSIGKTLAEKIVEMMETGELDYYNRLKAEVPEGLLDLLRVDGLGPKTVKAVWEKLDITTLPALKEAAESGALRELPRMGEKAEAKILRSIEALEKHGDDRTPIGEAWPIAQEMLAVLKSVDGVSKAEVAGSLRRMRETIGDIDLLVAADDPTPVMDAFCVYSRVEAVESRGETKCRVTLLNGIGVDLRVLPADRWGTLISYFTGSKAHNVRLRELALKQGLSLNEHSFTNVETEEEILCAEEADIYRTLNLPYILPTMREDRGELEAAMAGTLPTVIQQSDIISDLHMHSTWSDGKATILQMAQEAQRRGLRYICITDHSHGLGIANGLDEERLWQQSLEVQAADAEMGDDFRVLHGTEMEIKADASLDFDDDVLMMLDFVIASLHVSLTQPRAQVMKRIMAALENPHVDMIAHPTGRLLPDRPGADLDMEEVIKTAVSTNTILEINAHPRRLDLKDIFTQRAVELGAKIAINCDAHGTNGFDVLHYGVATAQRGWATKADVVNAWDWEKVKGFVGGE